MILTHLALTSVQKEGNAKDFEHATTLYSEKSAMDFYQKVKARLLDISHWQDVAGTGSAEFVLTDAKGTPVARPPKVGDHIKIDIPSLTHQHDWVLIEAIEEPSSTADFEMTGIKVRPSSNPLTNEHHVSHFFSSEATSSFSVQRDGMKVMASVQGRNEKPNPSTKSLWQQIKNWFVSVGAIAGVATIQWESLVKGFVRR